MSSDLIERLDNYSMDWRERAKDVQPVRDAIAEIASLRTALATEREASDPSKEAAEWAAAWYCAVEYRERAESSLAEARRLLRPFADAARLADGSGNYILAGSSASRVLCADDLRAAARFLAQEAELPSSSKGGQP